MRLLYLSVAGFKKKEPTREYNFVQGFSFRIRNARLEVELRDRLPENFFSTNDMSVSSEDDTGNSVVEAISAIVGVNGCGKTMTARFLARALGCDETFVRWLQVIVCGNRLLVYGTDIEVNIDDVKKSMYDAGYVVEDKRDTKNKLPLYEYIYYTPFCADQKVFWNSAEHYHDLSPASFFDQKDFSSVDIIPPVCSGGKSETSPLNTYSRLIQSEIMEFVYDYYANGLDRTAHVSFPVPHEVWLSDVRFEVYGDETDAAQTINKRIRVRIGNSNLPYRQLFAFASRELHVGAMCCSILKGAIVMINTSISDKPLDTLRRSGMLRFLEALIRFGQKVRDADKVNGAEGKLGYIWHHVLNNECRSNCYAIITSALSELSNDTDMCEIVKWDQLLIVWKSLVKIEEKYNGDVDDDLMICPLKDKDAYSNLLDLYMAHNRMQLPAPFLRIRLAHVSSGEMSYLAMFARLHRAMKSLGYNRNTKSAPSKPLHMLVFIDEAETTMHPEWQRQLVSNVIWYFEGFTSNVRAHVIFASHSPMLLSDLPIDNVIFLDNEYEKSGMRNTFGANIFDLYRLAFNQANGPMGAFAKRKIDKALKKVAEVVSAKHSMNYDPNNVGNDDRLRLDDETEATLKLIGDPLIDRYLKSLHEGGLL